MRFSHQLESALTEKIGNLVALGWKPTPAKPPDWTVTYVKDGKKLFKKKGSWYLDDEKLGRLSDKKLIAKLAKG